LEACLRCTIVTDVALLEEEDYFTVGSMAVDLIIAAVLHIDCGNILGPRRGGFRRAGRPDQEDDDIQSRV
jgi:hypothetical protein